MPTLQAVRRVLVVEDNVDSRETLRFLVETWGHDVKVAEDGREGIDLALAFMPDAAIVDIGLPIFDGYHVARKIREALSDRIRLIALTAYNQPEDRQRALESGFDFFITKPADLEELAELLAS